jgi:hypothetical protein
MNQSVGALTLRVHHLERALKLRVREPVDHPPATATTSSAQYRPRPPPPASAAATAATAAAAPSLAPKTEASSEAASGAAEDLASPPMRGSQVCAATRTLRAQTPLRHSLCCIPHSALTDPGYCYRRQCRVSPVDNGLDALCGMQHTRHALTHRVCVANRCWSPRRRRRSRTPSYLETRCACCSCCAPRGPWLRSWVPAHWQLWCACSSRCSTTARIWTWACSGSSSCYKCVPTLRGQVDPHRPCIARIMTPCAKPIILDASTMFLDATWFALRTLPMPESPI